MKKEPGFIPVGGVVKAHGIRGEFGIRSYADSPALFDAVPALFLSDGKGRPRPIEIASWRPHKELILMTSPQVTDRDQAEALRGRELLVREQDLPELEDGELYLHELIGCRVVLTDGSPVGELTGFYETGEQDTWVIVNEAGVEILLPAVPEFVLDVDLDSETIVIEPPEGLLDLYLSPPPEKPAKPKKPRPPRAKKPQAS
ncbi:MAG: ribosome maturation factor RimM [Pseudodesulfovibrio sp.]|jgi:16S rRNA processing protein RimM|uniref:Ribosome maturation factor RimM n=1 Tax=Pseudodesulfovibrio indicus TaxID=1716143 RepID=A0A126QL68_9BACT|nr:ribosome maturation factor RimM [Pseudodesulfovibrio indicus]AMK10529.1 16S rRNA processing protein RimM [Pseudodesulfovibrio indicus]TDT89071.1 16S rRNA processing protein RimM [Pseudodesulfovibrio indicus]